MAIYFDEATRTFFLEGKNISYVFGINETNFPEHYYFGEKIGRDDLRYSLSQGGDWAEAAIPGERRAINRKSYNHYGAEISMYGCSDYHECMLQVKFANGSRINEFLYDSYEILSEKPAIEGMPSMRGGETLKLVVKDKNSDIKANLYYTVYDDVDVICRRMEVINGTNEDITILRAYSFTLELPRNDFDMLSLQGAWARERRPERTPLHHGVTSIDSKAGASSGRLNPFAAILDKNTDEYHGNAIGVNLVYSGSFVIKADVGSNGNTRVMGGINDFDFSWKLDAGETFATPEAVIVYSANGINEMSQNFHDAYRKYLINPRFVRSCRPIVINNWEATYFDFNTERLKGIIDVVKGSGIDTFVLDDGWFGVRNNDRAGLGDWVVNTEKLQGGLKPIIDYCHEAGMKFGLWFEPEMVNPDSDLYRAHPDWAIKVPGVEPSRARCQLVLDITRSDVRDYIVDVVSKILREHEIDYVKWDFNRALTENFSSALPAERQQEVQHRFVLGFYDICERLVNGFPNIMFEGCAGGGGRMDPGTLYYFPQYWLSDDTDAYMRTQIQYGSSICYPLSAMSCHTSICPNHQSGRTVSFKTRADIAHLGATGYELDTKQLAQEEIEQIRGQVEDYHAMERLMLDGDLYRIESTCEGNYFAVAIVSKDKSEAHITAMRALCIPNDEVKRIYPKGLDKNAVYHIKELDIDLSGATIMNVGLVLPNDLEDFKTFIFTLKRV